MRKVALLILHSIFSLSYAQTEAIQVSVALKNGDLLTGTSDLNTIPFKTDFGMLNFPIDQVNSINIGLKDSRFDKGNLLKLLGQIEDGSEAAKEKAFDEILGMDEGAIPFVKAYLNASKGSSSNSDLSIQTLYEVLLAKNKIARNYSINDILTYNNEFRVEGSYDFVQLYLNTDYGRIKIERSDIARIDVKVVSEGLLNKNSFKLFANQNISGNKDEGWLNTGILVKKGEKLRISASGQIVLASLSGNTYTPDGGVNGSVGVEDNKLNYGQVVYKIGQGGLPNKAGDNLSTVASHTGIIYLAIYESVYNSANAGYYTVNVLVD